MMARTMSASPLDITHEPFAANHSSASVRHVEGRSCHPSFSRPIDALRLRI
jgi:hypothetical protein